MELITLQTHPGPVMKTGFSPCTFSHREKPPVYSGNPVMKTGFSLCWKSTQGKPCSGPVLACSVIFVVLPAANSTPKTVTKF